MLDWFGGLSKMRKKLSKRFPTFIFYIQKINIFHSSSVQIYFIDSFKFFFFFKKLNLKLILNEKEKSKKSITLLQTH